MSEPEVGVRYLDLDDLIDVVVFATDGAPAIRDIGLLESAIYRPMSSAFGADAYPTLHLKAAALLESLARNHALVDGNKRSAWLACWLFLRLNGQRLDVAPDAAFDLIIGVAEGQIELSEAADALAGWSTTT